MDLKQQLEFYARLFKPVGLFRPANNMNMFVFTETNNIKKVVPTDAQGVTIDGTAMLWDLQIESDCIALTMGDMKFRIKSFDTTTGTLHLHRMNDDKDYDLVKM